MEARLDKWLWAARIFKTRTLASEACKKGRVSSNGTTLKASKIVKVGDVIDVKKPPITYSFRIKQAIEKRVGAKLIPDVLENVTRPDQYELLEMNKISGFVNRARGTGRPTKKDRRSLDEFTEPAFAGDFDFMDFDFDQDDDELDDDE
ncbi:MAG: RNA-binding S4 domain-containing protein [Bacteroidaceae bacterium]|jgi:ribosome-associated heat shock protein Hsp15|uniref:RNA-binding S4 domain-containing protein n=1 Tax=unclassified Bacteroides TaxID=2646097 RepID=UPI0004E28303|nr:MULTISPECIES: RNA-binding S4 domain-containing protein [unclassified Bacteroides]MBP3243777.1 RNA-binding S4 domain-containing protein [Bacteroidaceae bacterium]SDF95407.1 heat shock protein Hsp15 [Bacteroidales bacterium KHT7]MBP5220206.1 RNA-binding S4 domain-containing protein [Bacteroidaceae bacterium]MBQ1676598.1 RNA-binding S4 domain-containing protein [Bacteroidaceae bacterium]MBQ3771089.1 RNA-binding S4 domain-containing protein [Bacteroidaceae bacterium]